MEPEKIKESIIRAAKDLFRKYGYHKTSVNEIAKKARIAKATIYKYFESKEQVLDAILMDYLDLNLREILKNKAQFANEEEHLKALVMKTCRLTYTVCNEFIGWDFVRENANSQEFLKHLSDQLESLLLAAYLELDHFRNNPSRKEGLAFLLKASKSIVFSFAFTSVSDSDVRKNFVSFQKELLPFLVKAAL
ncbi:TetR/AcrR family transcriptional regulator [Pedobacter duraquae]|uniref:TetR family transcriptional regulator n=1 Tax=Pedobacter duraquae TaxID=425511 RepID=A0A4R6IBY4_9SPHI|nr:TetR/AcrR family transcriptional regulator [Pedobacter duraquae]RZM25382.1 MAG: TetR/AcrR family transcriptional regulator [Pedobacter sp.]TDO19730.1 TetR family transcriptional regulator [Pedobacter duraquae]